MILVAIIISLLIKKARLDCKIDNRTPYSRHHTQLQDNFYECMQEPPTGNLKDIKLLVHLDNYYFDVYEESLSINTQLQIKWQEPEMQWNPEEYEGINRIELSTKSFSIWTPLQLLYHKEDYRDTDYTYYEAECRVTNEGGVICTAPYTYTVPCKTSLENWPFDTQFCVFQLGLKNYLRYDLVVKSFLLRSEFEKSTGWNIIHYDMIKNITKNTATSMFFVVERQAIAIAETIIPPSLTVVVLVMTSVILDAKSNIRLGLAIFSLLANFRVLQSVGELIPHYGSDTPKILLFIRSSIFICTFSLCLCLILKSLSNKRSEPHRWVIAINDYLLKSRYKRLFLKWQNVPDDEIVVGSWATFVCFINSFCVYIVFSIYFILLISYIPRPNSKNVNYKNYFQNY